MFSSIGLIPLLVVLSQYAFQPTSGHGYLADPPARSTAWMFDSDFSKCCAYYNHNEMSCGGTNQQWAVNGGKCSICGEPFDRQKKLFGVGGTMYLGKIVRTYTQGSVIPVTVVLTANHLGVFEFRVCSIDKNAALEDATQPCLDLNVLKTTNGSTQYDIAATYQTVHVNVTLPADLVCKHCVFQWRYRTGNSWGTSHGRSCRGCGRENEEFYGCSDIAIVNARTTPPVQSNRALSVIRSRKCTLSATFSQSFDIRATMQQYCETVCSNNCAAERSDANAVLYQGCIDTCDKMCNCFVNV